MIIKPKLTRNFTQVSNDIINHKSLSNVAKLLCIKILSLPPSWQINSKYLGDELGMSARSANRYLKELIDAGIFVKSQKMDEESGKFTNNFTIIFKSADEKEESLNVSIKQPKNGEIENETPKNDGLARDDVAESMDKPQLEERDKKPSSGSVSHIYNIQSIQNKKNMYRMVGKEILLFFAGHKVKKNRLDFSGFDEKEREKIKEWFVYKGEIKNKRLTMQSQELQLKKLKNLKLARQNIITIIERSIENGWQGLFPLFSQTNNKKRQEYERKQKEREELLAYFDKCCAEADALTAKAQAMQI